MILEKFEPWFPIMFSMFKSMGPIRYISTVFWPSLIQIIMLKWPFTDQQEVGGNHVNHDMGT